MLIKEYRIPLPVTVEEYRIAQLYMIAKKSREESRGAGSGVEILVNEPYEDGPGGKGQYTHKIYHVGSHLPGWFKSLLPKSALTVEEEAWNAYPYTKTRYTCPFVEKFSLEIETYYCDDDGHQENVFSLSGNELRNRTIDLIDVVKDQLYGADYNKDEDPKFYISQKTGRGPLQDNWIEEYWRECQGKRMPLHNGKAIMCAYKLCRVEFRYWGMQSKIEKFIHDVALRKTMLRAHRQAWAWQDEWYGLKMEDIRQIERQTQEALKRKMAGECGEDESPADNGLGTGGHHSPGDKALAATMSSIEKPDREAAPGEVENSPISSVREEADSLSDLTAVGKLHSKLEKSPERLRRSILIANKPQDLSLNLTEGGFAGGHEGDGRRKLWSRSSSRATLNSPDSSSGKSFDMHLANWRMESIVRDSETDSEDEFFDCQEDVEDSVSLTKWSSMDLLPQDEAETPAALADDKQVDSIFSQSFIHRVTSEREKNRNLQASSRSSIDASLPPSPTLSPSHHSCSTTVLFMVIHAGSVLDANVDPTARKSDITTFRGAFESVLRQHYPSMVGRIAIKHISCPSICTEGLGVLSSLSPYSFDVSPSTLDSTHVTNDSIPIGVIPIFAISNPDYQEAVSRVVSAGNHLYHEFIKSEEGQGFNGQVVIIGDSVGAILAYDALLRTTQAQQMHLEAEPPSPDDEGGKPVKKPTELTPGSQEPDQNHNRHLTAATTPGRRRSSSSSDSHHHPKFEFEVSEFFMFGTPLPILLAYRKVLAAGDKNAPIPRPACQQVYNLFHPTDPLAARLEPLLSARFSMLPPVNVSRYQKYPLGDGQPCHLLEFIQANPQLFADGLGPLPPTASASFRRMSEISIQSTISGLMDSLPLHTINASEMADSQEKLDAAFGWGEVFGRFNTSEMTHRWWGAKRLDYALYCPEGLANFPTNALPHLFHASYWESSDVVAFILRQIGRLDAVPLMGHEEKDMVAFSPNQPREKWMKKRTSVKLKVRMKFGSENVSANHRANDVIVREGAPQVLTARFMYGPLDMVTLTGEKVDIHIMKEPPAGEWILLGTEVTDKTGRVTYVIPEEKALGYGMYPVKMVVRGDHTLVDFYVCVVPPRTECVVFSIDGSFTASVSVTGKDPKVRAGAVDVVRHWQELGYVIIYVTGRPDMQQQRVVSWLAQHNFPHGLVSFADGLSTDPLGHKADYLRNLVQNHGLIIHAAYGSSKDIGVYSSVGLKPERIFIVGKVSKKQQNQAQVLQEGYAAHLGSLTAHGGSRPAQGNARMVIPRGCFSLPGQGSSLRRRRWELDVVSFNMS